MSWNKIRIDEKGAPVLVENETQFCMETNVSFEYENGGGFPGSGESLAGTGILVLTTLRLIFVQRAPTISFSSFSCPLANIEDATFYQGWFSGSGLSATIKSVPNDGLTKEYGRIRIGFSSKNIEWKAAFDHLMSKVSNAPTVIEELPSYEGPVESADIDNGPPAYM